VVFAEARCSLKQRRRVLWCAAAGVLLPPAAARAEPAEVATPPTAPVAQVPHRNHLGASLGLTVLETNDELVRGLRWLGLGGELRFFFRRESGASRHFGNLRFPVGLVVNRYDHAGLAWDAQLDYGHARVVGLVAGKVELAAGARVRWDWALQYYVDFDEEHLYWMNAYELGPLVAARWPLGAGRALVGELDSPVVAAVSRPPTHRYYKVDRLTHPTFLVTKTHEDLRLTSVHEHQGARLRLGYRHALGPRSVLEVRYALDFTRESEPRRFLLLMHNLSAGVARAF